MDILIRVKLLDLKTLRKSVLNENLGGNLVCVVAILGLIFGLIGVVSAQESSSVCIWDYSGNCEAYPYSTSCLCNHGHQYNPGVKSSSFTIAEATQINSITFELYYTTCQSGGNWNFYLNDVLITFMSGLFRESCKFNF